MDSERIREVMSKIPVGLLVALYLLYLGYDAYIFKTSEQSDLGLRFGQVQALEQSNQKLEADLVKAEEFIKSLEVRRLALRTMATRLNEMKATLSEQTDIPLFIKMIVTEAKKVGLTVVGINPGQEKREEFYIEQGFQMGFKGVYVQLLVFLERLSNVQKIIRIDDLQIKPTSRADRRYVELEGKVLLKVYRYFNSKADDIAKSAVKAGGQGQ